MAALTPFVTFKEDSVPIFVTFDVAELTISKFAVPDDCYARNIRLIGSS